MNPKRSVNLWLEWEKLKSWIFFWIFSSKIPVTIGKLHYISRVLTTRFHSDTNSDKKNNNRRKKKKQVPTAVFHHWKKPMCFWRTPKESIPPTRQPHPPWSLGFPDHQVILHSEGCSQERQFPLALLLTPRVLTVEHGNLCGKKTKTFLKNVSNLPFKTSWKPLPTSTST